MLKSKKDNIHINKEINRKLILKFKEYIKYLQTENNIFLLIIINSENNTFKNFQ